MTMAERFVPTRTEALTRLAAFLPHAGREYADRRNFDAGPNQPRTVSLLSPYIRHRLISERDVVAAVLARHRFADAEKYVQEVLWRTYWKGWLEQRPAVWDRYIAERDQVRASFKGKRDLDRAENGLTGIEGFDDWARELVETGYLHNHARMWFASIWIFTLRLPWTLGADFFMRHLVDADPASNTLSWRWVAGLQTAGKTYLASADNIARYTHGRFAPTGLATTATALTESPIPAPAPVTPPHNGGYPNDAPVLLVITPEDMHPESLFDRPISVAAAVIIADTSCDGAISAAFIAGAASDTAARVQGHFGCPVTITNSFDANVIAGAATAAKLNIAITANPAIGPTADALRALASELGQSGIRMMCQQRSWDARFWPHARKGFFAFKDKIPQILAQEGLC